MSITQLKPKRIKNELALPLAPKTAKVVRIDADGRAWVNISGDGLDAVIARTILPLDNDIGPDTLVLLMFENGDPALPIIIGIVRDKVKIDQEIALPKGDDAASVFVDRKRLVFDAQEEIVLRCGLGSITLKANGKIVIKGMELISRALGSNKIKGGAVSIN